MMLFKEVSCYEFLQQYKVLCSSFKYRLTASMNIKFCWCQLLREHQSDFGKICTLVTSYAGKHPWETSAARKIPKLLYQRSCMWLLCWYMITNQTTFYCSFISLWKIFGLQSGALKTSDRKVFPNFKAKSTHSRQDRLSDTSVYPVSIGLCAFCFCCLQSAGYLGRLNSYSYQNASLAFVVAVFTWQHYFYLNPISFAVKCLTCQTRKEPPPHGAACLTALLCKDVGVIF